MRDGLAWIRAICRPKPQTVFTTNCQEPARASEFSEEQRIEAELARLRATARYTPVTTDIFGRDLAIVDSASFVFMYQEIMQRQIYKFAPTTPSPLIIDGGANIGLSVLFFKWNYPQSRVIAIEPDLKVFSVLQRNVVDFDLKGVTLINKALWNDETTVEFMSEGADAGRLHMLDQATPIYQVETIRLRSMLDQPVGLLKLDIEGAETEVLTDSADLLYNVSNIFVEYHSFSDKPQTLHLIIDILNQTGFRLNIQSSSNSSQPFLAPHVYLGMDMQLNIFGYRAQGI